jgi:hypothetical protein
MTHAELLRNNVLGIEVPSCDGLMVLVRVDHVCAIGDAGAEEPTIIEVNRCQCCGDFVEISNHEVVEAGAECPGIDLGTIGELCLTLRPSTGRVYC